MTLTHLKLANYKKEVTDSKNPVIIDFYADWCGPCKMMAPVFEELSKEYEKKLKFMKLDTEEESTLAQQFGVRSIPTLIIIHRGAEVDRIVGFVPKDSLKKSIDAILKKAK